MKISVDKQTLKKMIVQTVEAGNIQVDGNVITFRGKNVSEGVLTKRLTKLLLYTEVEKWQKLAFKIIEATHYEMCHFTPMMMAEILFEYESVLPANCTDKIKEYLYRVKEEFVGHELDFVGVNDNFGMMSTYTAMSQGILFNDDKMKKEALRRFGQLEMILKRRGTLSEYNSMTYTPLQLYVLSCLQKTAPDERLKTIARNAQRRIWADLAAHFHSSTGEISGPFSRHYISNLQTAHKFIYELFNPKNKIELPDFEEHSGAVEILYYLTAQYEIDEEIYNLMMNKKYPFEVFATTEYCASTDATPEAATRDMSAENDFYEYPAGVSGLYTYQTEYYGIGTATNEWHNGVQTSSFIIDYKRNNSENGICDSKQIYCRYLLNDEQKEKQPFMDQGRKMAFGKYNKAVVLYKPKVAAIPAVYSGLPKFLEEHYKKQEVSGNIGVTSAKLVIVIPKKGIDEIIIGDEKVKSIPYASENAKSVYIKDGDIYLAFHPLAVTDLGAKNKLTIAERNGNIEIALWNYNGEKRDFAKREFIHARNGFAVTVNCIEDVESFENFMKKESKTVICDEYIMTTHSRQTYIRSVCVKNGDMKLSCEYSPASEGIKNIACNDYPIEYPKLKMTGVDIEKLPYINKS